MIDLMFEQPRSVPAVAGLAGRVQMMDV